MISRLRTKLTYANVIATIALFVALGGGAYAAVNLPANSVTSKTIRNGQVKGADVKEGSLGTVPKAKNAELTHGLRTYRVSKSIDEGQDSVTVWKHGAFKLKLGCFVPPTDDYTQAYVQIGSPREGMDFSSVAGREGNDPTGYANDGADAGEYDFVGVAYGLNEFAAPGNASFAATLPASAGHKQQTVTGNIVFLARHHATGKDCSVSGQVSAG